MKWIFLLIVLWGVSCISNRRTSYEDKINELNLRIEGIANPIELIEGFKEKEGLYPESLKEVYDVYKNDYPDDISQIVQVHFLDEFSSKNEWFGYIPIYDSKDSCIISFLLLSAGIDGKLDNIHSSHDKFHLDDWDERLSLYNLSQYKELDGEQGIDYTIKRSVGINIPYSAYYEKHGNKDLLIYWGIR